MAREQSVYFNVGLGWADATYEDELENLLDQVADLPGVSHTAVSVDLTLYFPVGFSGMLGPSLTGIGDRYEEGGDHFQINNYLFGASYRTYPGGERGRGLFLRADVGFAKVGISASGADDFTSDAGFGVLFGGGYSWQIGGGTWFSLNADYAMKSVEDEKVGGLSIGAAFLF